MPSWTPDDIRSYADYLRQNEKRHEADVLYKAAMLLDDVVPKPINQDTQGG